MRRSPLAPRLLLAVALALSLATPACRRRAVRRAPPVIEDPIYGTLDGRRFTLAELGEAVGFVRARLASPSASPPPSASAVRGRRVFLAVHAGPRVVVSTGLGPTLGASLSAAADDARARLEGLDLGSARLALDVTTARVARPDAGRAEDLGAEGFLRARDAAHVGWVTPGELLQAGLLRGDDGETLAEGPLERRLRLRLGDSRAACAEADACARSRFRTFAVVESSPGGPVRPLSRGRLPRPEALDVGALRHRVELAARHLAGLVDDEGRYTYLYDPAGDRTVDDDYSALRHAGATHALFEAYEELRDPLLLAAGERALGWLDQRLGALDDRLYLLDEDDALGAIGGSGLALLAFAKHAAATRDARHLPRMRALGRFLVRQLDAEGRFQPFFAPGAPPLPSSDGLYYPGEAMLGLMRLYALDPRPEWLEAVTRAAGHRLSTPYAHARDEGRDYWFALALAELHRATGEARWADRAFLVADAIMREQDDDEADLRESGSFARMPRASRVSTALEALATAVALARFVRRDEGAMMAHARRATTLVAWHQHDEEGVFAFPAPAKALGGIHGDPWRPDVRVDLAQHGLMALLCVLRATRDPAFGRTGAPSPLGVTPL